MSLADSLGGQHLPKLRPCPQCQTFYCERCMSSCPKCPEPEVIETNAGAVPIRRLDPWAVGT